jgi:hypothetical protein
MMAAVALLLMTEGLVGVDLVRVVPFLTFSCVLSRLLVRFRFGMSASTLCSAVMWILRWLQALSMCIARLVVCRLMERLP